MFNGKLSNIEQLSNMEEVDILSSARRRHQGLMHGYSIEINDSKQIMQYPTHRWTIAKGFLASVLWIVTSVYFSTLQVISHLYGDNSYYCGPERITSLEISSIFLLLYGEIESQPENHYYPHTNNMLSNTLWTLRSIYLMFSIPVFPDTPMRSLCL